MCQVFVFYTFSYLMFIFRISTNNSTITLLFQLLHFCTSTSTNSHKGE